MTNISNSSLKFSKILKSVRTQRNWSQKALSEKLKVSEETIKHWEKGGGVPQLFNREKLCELFEMSLEELGLVGMEKEASFKTSASPSNSNEVLEQHQFLEPKSQEKVNESENSPKLIIESERLKLNEPLRESSTLRQSRRRMIEILQLTYENLLEKSLQGAILLNPALKEKGDVVSNAANLLLRGVNQNERLLPSGTTILQAYDAALQAILILGEPGVGKSTLLVELAKHLIERAKENDNCPLPVIVPLSSWAKQRLPLAGWLIEQISQIYSISHQLSEYWLNEQQFLPLLDSLDEMEQEALPGCIAAINCYHQEYQGTLVVCCRTIDYENAKDIQPLMLQSAVVVQPLSQAQVNTTLEQMGEPLIVLRQTMEKNSALQELATKPLMLNLLIRAYQGVAIDYLPAQTCELQQRVLQDYVQRMVAQKGDDKHYPLDRTHLWLRWFAQKIRQHNLDVFYLEHLQPTWLPTDTERFRLMYEIFAGKGISILIGALISLSFNADLFGGESFANNVLFSLTGGLVGWLIYSDKKEKFNINNMKHVLKRKWLPLIGTSVRNGLLVGVLIGFTFALWPPEGSRGGLIAGMSVFICLSLLSFIIQSSKLPESISSPKGSPLAFLSFSPGLRGEHIEIGLFTGVLLSICISVSGGVSMGVSAGLSYTVIGTFLSLILLGKDSSIELKETVTLSVRNLVRRQHLLSTLYIFLLVFLLYGVSVELQHGLKYGLIYGFSGALSIDILYWIFIGLWTGVSEETLENKYRIEFNQGIRYSFRNALRVGLFASGISIFAGAFCDILNYELRSFFIDGFPIGLQSGFSEGLKAIVRDVLFFELFGALLPFLLMGGVAWLRHYLLRWLLYRAKVAPIGYKHFLDDAVQRVLLYPVGGGYRFIHRTLLDFFAEQDVETPL